MQNRGARYRQCTLENFQTETEDQQETVQKVRDYLQSFTANYQAGKNLIFAGPPGTGKDHLAASVMREAIRQDKTVKWFSGVDLFMEAVDAVRQKQEFSWAKQLRKTGLLVISDLFSDELSSDLSAYEKKIVYSIFDYRYSHLLPTVLTLNIETRSELEHYLTTPITDRLFHNHQTIMMFWKSWRKK